MNNLFRLEEFFTARGYATADISLLQPAEPFLDTAGEDMRRRIYMTSDRTGKNLCLRPEFTIPVCLAHLKNGAVQGRYSYGGIVFRQSDEGSTEFEQAGIEVIGSDQSNEADVECVATALDALAHCGVGKMRVVFGDQAIFEALLCALDLPAAWRAKLGRAFGDTGKLENDLLMIANGGETVGFDIAPQMRDALAAQDINQVQQLIEAKMSAANLPASGGRTAAHIAGRMMAKAELAASQLSSEQREILNAFLQLEVQVGKASDKLRSFAHDANLDLDREIDLFCMRSKLLNDICNDQVEIIWRANFGRRLDYYTGIVFEIFEDNQDQSLCGGGRYNHLMSMLGASEPVPAIGFSIRCDRLEGVSSCR